MACLSPRESAEFIASHSQDVTINADAAPHIARLIGKSEYGASSWRSHPLNPQEANEAAIDWIFLVDTLNFSFWTPDDAKYKVTFKGETHTGYWALCAAVNRAIQEGIALTSASYLSSVTLAEVNQIFRGDDPAVVMPLISERLKVMQDTGKTLLQKFAGSFVQCVTQSGASAVKLVELVAEHFPSYQDRAQFQGRTVSFYKRAQILVADIWACFGGQGLGTFRDIDQMTMFADYRVPQVLVHFDILRYSEKLMQKLLKDVPLENGSREEVEIRGCSIWAVELVVKELVLQGHPDINAILVDYFLWDYRRDHSKELDSVPYHKTRSVYY